jgi:PLP dependent protein
MMSIAQRIAAIQERIAAAARRAGRNPAEVRLIAVTKTHPPELIAQAVTAGVHDLGENRIQEAEGKVSALATLEPRPTWHLIGHLQRNKAKTAVGLFDMFHSLDSLRLAETLNRHAAARATADDQRPLPVLLQVNVSGETGKEGFNLSGGPDHAAQWPHFQAEVEQILALPHLQVRGLMTIAPFADDPEVARPVFRMLRTLRVTLAQQFPQADWSQLSMGMTDDFEIAIEEGATIVRIGRAIFGARA